MRGVLTMFFRRKSKHSWEEVWNERQRALEQIFGPAEDSVWHAVVPYDIGGDADVLEFRQFLDGSVYVTADLTGPESTQLLNDGEQYELVMCTRSPADWAPNLIGRLGGYTRDTVLDHLNTSEIFRFTPSERMTKLAFARFPTFDTKFDLFGKTCRLLLCVGLYDDEFENSRAYNDNSYLLAQLQVAGVMPYTDPARDPVTLLPQRSAAR